MENDFIYKETKTKEISFPLGGIGSGCIGLAGNGRLIDWEIFNKPNKGSTNGFSHFAIKAEANGKVLDARVLNGNLLPPYTGVFNQPAFNTYGFGPPRDYLAGVPHFREVDFEGEFPIATLSFKEEEEKFPGRVRMRAFNPFIPLNDRDSSIPAAFFEIEVKNSTEKEILYTVCLSLRNPFPPGTTINSYHKKEEISLIKLTSDKLGKSDPEFGDLTVATDGEDVSYQEYWYRGAWFDNLNIYWRDLNTPGRFKNRTYLAGVEKSKVRGREDHCLLATHINIKSGETRTVRFITSWNFPNCINYWNPEGDCKNENRKPKIWKNYYKTLFSDSTESALYSLNNWERLYRETLAFKNTLFSSTMPLAVLDAISANISILKSPTVLRLEDGTFYGWEGCHPNSGCCEGSCTHVWNYAYALPFLFPKLERSMWDADFKYNLASDGSMSFRLQLPLGRERWAFRPCVDGQYGGVMKAYRDWKISGDNAWLKSHWEAIKKCIEFAWSEKNKDRWDRNKDGVLEGRQHHTLDMELFGPNSWLTGFYLAALKVGSEMAEHFGEADRAKEYRALFEKGKKWVDENLFNGEYYHQRIDLGDKKILEEYREGDSMVGSTLQAYWSGEHHEIKYQVARGCGIDQVLAQWHANISGLGEIYNKNQTQKALRSIFKYNFKKSMQDFFNPCRIFCLNTEAGLIICEYPKDKPAVPVPYAEETMNGFEYQAACHMIQEGMISEGLEIVKAVRDRFDGEKRNPWNEFECGSNYARSMASYALLLALSGFEFDMAKGHIGFSPKINQENFYCFWSLNYGWGSFEIQENKIRFTVKWGHICLNTFACSVFKTKQIETITVGDEKVSFAVKDGCVRFESAIDIKVNEALCAIVK